MSKVTSLQLLGMAAEAGQQILRIQQSGWSSCQKQDGSPLTDADLASHKVLKNSLRHWTPDYPIMSEEDELAPVVNHLPEAWWIIDPLDGTKEFVAKDPEFAINIALIRNQKVCAGVVFAPQLGEFVVAGEYQRSLWGRFEPEQLKENQLDWAQILQQAQKCHVSGLWPENGLDKVLVLCSRYHPDTHLIQLFQQNPHWHPVPAGASLKFMRLAKGEADYYPRHQCLHCWDVAAGHAILKGAGGNVYEMESRHEILYPWGERRVSEFEAY